MMRSKTTLSPKFGVCTDNSGYTASLEVGKLYAVVPDPAAAKHGYVRVIDESGEDYGYSAERFFMLNVPPALVSALNARGHMHVGRPSRALQTTVASRRRLNA
jgi:hypothetical protein